MLKARQCVREMREYHSPLSSPSIDLRLDMNESTTGCSPRVLAKLNSMQAATLARYPRREDGEKLVADFLSVPPAQLLLTNGADEAIDLLCRAYLEPDSEIIVVVPTFGMYEVFAQMEAPRSYACRPARIQLPLTTSDGCGDDEYPDHRNLQSE